ncbi:hypothetical protein BGX21_003499 [Mortierella sp. AD011]|nr:hypothetical protein BGX21_003499 [Mortierella sp. AD011]
MPEFSNHFGYIREQDAHAAFMNPLSSTELPKAIRTVLTDKYNIWRRNGGANYWASRAVEYKIEVSTKNTAGSLVERSNYFAKNLLQKPPRDKIKDVDNTAETERIHNDFSIEGNGLTTNSLAADSEYQVNVDSITPRCNYPTTTISHLEPEPNISVENSVGDQTKKRTKAEEKFSEAARNSLQRRHSALGPKWLLKSGTVVEDVLLQAGLDLSVDHPIRRFMIDLNDKYTESLFSLQDWTEIKSNLPSSATYSKEVADYIDTLEDIVHEQDIIGVLNDRPHDPEKAIVHRCAESWCDLCSMDPSPFVLESILSEDWWMNNAWSGARLLTKAVPGSYIITGEATGIDSTSRRNNKERHVDVIPHNNRKKMGVRADMIWRTMDTPIKDWMIVEAARQWDENAGKYIQESTFKVPRQLHDILSARSLEVGGPVIQRVSLCWGTQGTNVTRFKRRTPARIHPSLKQQSLSLDAARQLLLVRAETLRLMNEYNRAEREERMEKRARVNRYDDTDDEVEWRDLLNSSP